MLRRLCFRWADCVFAVSRGLRDYYASELGILENQLGIVPNGVDTERFRYDPDARTQLRQKLTIGLDTMVVGTVARLDPVKDHRTLFRAAELALSRGVPLRLVIVGDGPERATLEHDIQRRPLLCEQTLFAGEARNIARWLNSFDVFALPSLAEGMSNTLLEAMAVGVPPVASRVGGNPEVIEDGRSGLLFEARDAETLAVYLQELALNREWRHSLGTKARQRVQSCFSLQGMLDNYTQLYEGVLRNRRNYPSGIYTKHQRRRTLRAS
jgi:glycosyltransferase involved in cell wall biosynthesis